MVDKILISHIIFLFEPLIPQSDIRNEFLEVKYIIFGKV